MPAACLPDLRGVRQELGLSQSEMADLLGVSARTIQSCEQGWRKPGPAVEKAAILLLVASRQGRSLESQSCWETLNCPQEAREKCWAYRSGQGHLCWLLTGNVCHGRRARSWDDKKAMCLECVFCQQLLRPRGAGQAVPECAKGCLEAVPVEAAQPSGIEAANR